MQSPPKGKIAGSNPAGDAIIKLCNSIAVNLILLEPEQVQGELIRLTQRQQDHLINVLKVADGDELCIGLEGGNMGRAKALIKANSEVALRDAFFDQSAPRPIPLTLILALPRPQMLKRILQSVAMFGVEKLILLQTAKVEKSFWQSPSCTDQAIREQLRLGLEQAKSTIFPKIEKQTRFKPFVEDTLQTVQNNKQCFMPHPGSEFACPTDMNSTPAVVAIGPEGGFNQYEIEQLQRRDFLPVHLGERILKVETAVNAVLGRWL
jgi:16S rRNA (uracil1498-N3)-methyltransferase